MSEATNRRGHGYADVRKRLGTTEAWKWIRSLEFKHRRSKGQIYFDRHEPKDKVEYRKGYVMLMLDYRK